MCLQRNRGILLGVVGTDVPVSELLKTIPKYKVPRPASLSSSCRWLESRVAVIQSRRPPRAPPYSLTVFPFAHIYFIYANSHSVLYTHWCSPAWLCALTSCSLRRIMAAATTVCASMECPGPSIRLQKLERAIRRCATSVPNLNPPVPPLHPPQWATYSKEPNRNLFHMNST